MALKGNLSDFSLPDVFTLIQLSKKTGVLRIVREGCEGSIWFRDGEVFFATSDWRRELLGQRLVSEGKITPNALERALALRRAEPVSGRRLGTILVDEGYLVPSTLQTFVQEQIQDTIFDLMRWDDGAFHFEPLTEIPADEDIGLSISVENIVMEGSRRLDEWNRIRRKIPSMDMVFRMSTAPGQGTFEISLKPAEWKLLLALDGARSVAELAYVTRRTDFEVARALYGLHSAGLLELAGDEDVEAARERRRVRAARLETARESGRQKEQVAARTSATDATGPVRADEPAFLTSPAVDAGPPVADFDTMIAETAPDGAPETPAVPAEEQPEPAGSAEESESAEAAALGTALMNPEPAGPAASDESAGSMGFVAVDVETALPPPFAEPSSQGGPLPEPLEESAEPPPPRPFAEESVPESVAVESGDADVSEQVPPPPSAEFASLIGFSSPSAGTLSDTSPVVEIEPLLEQGLQMAGEPGFEAEATQPIAQDQAEPLFGSPEPHAVFGPRPEEAAALESESAVAETLVHEPAPTPAPELVPEPTVDLFDQEFSSADAGVLGDELTALTGAERGRRTAPPARRASMDADGPLDRIRRDTRVDRDTIQRIIDGLERL